MSREIVYARINALYPGVVFTNHVVDTVPTEERPFIVLDWLGVQPGPHQEAPLHIQFLDIWVHDEKGSYLGIDNIIRTLRTMLMGLSPSATIAQIDWTGDGEDNTDDGFDTIFRTSSFRVVGSGR
jgi:hypothetical protein